MGPGSGRGKGEEKASRVTLVATVPRAGWIEESLLLAVHLLARQHGTPRERVFFSFFSPALLVGCEHVGWVRQADKQVTTIRWDGMGWKELGRR